MGPGHSCLYSLFNELLKRSLAADDVSFVIVNEDLIQQALNKARASELDDVRTAIDGYRVCITTARRLLHNPPMEMKLRQVLECAVFCEKKLAGFAAVSRLRPIQHRKAEKQFHHIILSVD